MLGHIPGMTVVAEAGDGHEALRLIKELEPDVVLSDITAGATGAQIAAAVNALNALMRGKGAT